jgi:hypothetical protein
MASMTASVGEQRSEHGSNPALKGVICESIGRLADWLRENDYRGYGRSQCPALTPTYTALGAGNDVLSALDGLYQLL